MASRNTENPGFGQVTDHPSQLGSGRVIRQSLRLGQLSRLVPVSPTKIDAAGIYGAAMWRSRWVVLWNPRLTWWIKRLHTKLGHYKLLITENNVRR
ncbi:hypothetical protein DdX_09768 [Ditylenchus destructor]|uniref:Uncharacterized protein n=1 Tax=Ditylenchus destructor TaxID=166010 RepID=A0AAD4N036_9BILA|nr:hypothetical protein DdX_09768 [Ditylenchus destructor]